MINNTNAAQWEGEAGIKEAEKIATSLSAFSKHLHDWKVQDIQKKTAEGVTKAREVATANAQKILELSEELKRTKREDTRYQEIKAEMLELGGPNAYPDADRLAGLSPWQQVGYAKEKLRAFNETFPDKLAHAMQNSEKMLTISGVNFTPKELHDNNIQGLPFKEAASKVLAEDIRKAANVDRFSPELLALAKTDETIVKAQDGLMAKYRERYNIDASYNTRVKAQKEWASSAKTGEDLHRLMLINSNTVDSRNNILGRSGGWDSAMSILTSEGIAKGDPFYAERIGALPLPEDLRIKVGAKAGTTFAQQWPGRFAKLRSDIKSGMVEANNAELKYQKTAGTKLEAEFIEKARKGDLSTQQVNDYKRQFGDLGLPVPSGVTNYETASMRDEREDKQLIKALMASNGGYISNQQLDQFHPLAALEFREKATKFEKAALKEFDAEAKIKGHLNTTFTGMGIKANEKSPAYIEALSNAKQDYARQYNDYIAMGHTPAHASHYALHGKPGEVKDTDGNPIPGRIGVLEEIKQNGANSKYVMTGQSVERSLRPGAIRVARIASGKREIRDDPNIVYTDVIGGAYGQRQLDSIKTNLDKYGPKRGIWKDKAARQYYEGLARGRDGNWMGLVDSQLKATGHPGLWPNERPPEQDLYQGRNVNGDRVEDPDGLLPVAKSMERASKYPSFGSYQYVTTMAKDARDYRNSPFSHWESQNMLSPWLRGN
jgi:hypothetical protein